MKERPILFSGAMVRAILAGEKTQTRRVMKPQPKPFVAHDEPGPFWWFDIHRKGFPVGRTLETDLPLLLPALCPYGQPGDRLWVRETFSAVFYEGNWYDLTPAERKTAHILDLQHRASFYDNYSDDSQERWVPSIFMLRSLSRIALEIIRVRVERLQDISEADMRAEGLDIAPNGEAGDGFQVLWDQINGAKYPWESNPFVWVIEFRLA